MLQHLPYHIIVHEIAQYLRIVDIARLSKTCARFRGMFDAAKIAKCRLSKIKNAYEEIATLPTNDVALIRYYLNNSQEADKYVKSPIHQSKIMDMISQANYQRKKDLINVATKLIKRCSSLYIGFIFSMWLYIEEVYGMNAVLKFLYAVNNKTGYMLRYLIEDISKYYYSVPSGIDVRLVQKRIFVVFPYIWANTWLKVPYKYELLEYLEKIHEIPKYEPDLIVIGEVFNKLRPWEFMDEKNIPILCIDVAILLTYGLLFLHDKIEYRDTESVLQILMKFYRENNLAACVNRRNAELISQYCMRAYRH